MKIKYSLIIFGLVLVLLPLVIAEEYVVDISNGTMPELNVTGQANCSEQLEICVAEYNALLEECRSGAWCGTGIQVLSDANKALSEEKSELEKQLNSYKRWKILSFVLFGLLVIWMLTFFIKGKRNK